MKPLQISYVCGGFIYMFHNDCFHEHKIGGSWSAALQYKLVATCKKPPKGLRQAEVSACQELLGGVGGTAVHSTSFVSGGFADGVGLSRFRREISLQIRTNPPAGSEATRRRRKKRCPQTAILLLKKVAAATSLTP